MQIERGPAWLLVVLLLSGCERCSEAKDRITGELKSPDEAEAERLVRERLPKEKGLAQKLCGVPTDSLTDVVLKLKKSVVPNTFHVEISAKPGPTAASSAAVTSSAEPGPWAADVAQMVACAGMSSVLFDAEVGEGGTVKGHTISSVRLDEVTTPGHEWKRARESSDWD